MAAGGVPLLAQCSSPLFGLEQEPTLVLRGTFTAEGQTYPNPTSANPFSKSLSCFVNDALGAGAEPIYRIARTNLAFSLASGGRGIPVERGFRATG
jgi:hypothetical protein